MEIKFRLTDSSAGDVYQSLQQVPWEGTHEIVIREVVKKRSVQANAFLHVTIKEIADHIGYDPAATKTILKYSLGFFHEIQGKDTKLMVFDETSDMSVSELNGFITLVEQWGIDKGVRFSQPEYAVAVG